MRKRAAAMAPLGLIPTLGKGEAMTIASFKSIPDMKAKVKASGSNFFERETMEFFHSTLESPLIHGTYFVTSEYPDDPADKRYTARYFVVTGTGFMDHRAIGEYGAYASVAEAKGAIFRNLENQRKQKEVADLLFREVELRYGPVPDDKESEALHRRDGQYLLADLREDGSGVDLIEGNMSTQILWVDFSDKSSFARHVRRQVDAKIADWLAD